MFTMVADIQLFVLSAEGIYFDIKRGITLYVRRVARIVRKYKGKGNAKMKTEYEIKIK
jgi:hypothetical protein